MRPNTLKVVTMWTVNTTMRLVRIIGKGCGSILERRRITHVINVKRLQVRRLVGSWVV